MIAINLFAGPGAGKSTLAAGLFYKLKCAGQKVELVTEYAKELVYEGNHRALDDQRHVSREQMRRQARLIGKVDMLVTDSPLPLGLLYGKPKFRATNEPLIWREWERYTNVNVFVVRCKPYQPWGRRRSEEAAKAVDRAVLDLLTERHIPFISIFGDERGPDDVLRHLAARSLLA